MTKLMRLDLILQETGNQWKCLWVNAGESFGGFIWYFMKITPKGRVIDENKCKQLGITMALTWRRQWQPTAGFLLGKSHWQRNLVSCSPWGRYELDTTEIFCFHFSLFWIGEGNDNPLQCSCRRIPGTGEPGGLLSMGSQSRTRLKRLSSSSSLALTWFHCHKHDNLLVLAYSYSCTVKEKWEVQL